ncbi:MAG: trigger factor [Acidimicrobiales bacterium]|jgi:trigger factor
MRATPTVLDNNRIKLIVEVDESEMATALDDTAAALAKQVSIKGFRKGKVPKNVLIAHLGGLEALRSEAIRESVPDFYAKAVADTLSDPIGKPDINIVAGESEGPLTFEAEVEVRPELEIEGQRDLRVTIPSPNVLDSEVDAQIDRFRETDATLRDVERPIQTGDLVTMDLHVEQIATDVEPLEMSDYMYTVGSGTITGGVDELILGLKSGEELKVNGSIGGGVVATYTMQLKHVKERVLPELNDEWVEENTEWKSVEEMREAILTQLRRRKVVEAQLSQRDAMLLALGDLVSVDLVPEVLIDSETNERLHDLGHRLSEQKMSLEMFLQVTNQAPEQLLATLREDAVRAVRIDLAMRALVKAESLEPTPEEIDEELESTAKSMNVEADLLRENLRNSGRVVSFNAEVAKMKASRWLGDNVTFVDPDGVEIDRQLLREDQSHEAEPEGAQIDAESEPSDQTSDADA